jgi:hypothetical protein
VLAGCAAARPLPPLPPAEPAALLRAVRERDERIATLRARFTARFRSASDERTVDGVLVIARPERFRLRLMMPFGLSVLDYLSTGDDVRVVSTFEADPGRNGGPPLSAGDLREVFLRGRHAFPGECLPGDMSRRTLEILCRDTAGVTLRRIRIDRGTGRIRDETSYRDGRPWVRFAFDDWRYRPDDGADLPHRVSLRYLERPLALEIAIRRFEVNPPLAAAVFEPVPP